MKLAILVLAAMIGIVHMDCNMRRVRDKFDEFRRQYRKSYKDQAEEDYRCSVFAKNLEDIESHNLRQARNLETYTKGVNKYTDYTQEEFISMFTGLKPELEKKTAADISSKTVRQYDPNYKAPASVDWRVGGYVTPVRNQGRCGSCWAFTTAAVIESRYLIHANKPWQWEDVSEQHYVECSSGTKYGNMACNGGLMTNTYKYMIGENHGCQHEVYYPYVSADGNNGTTCSYEHGLSPFGIKGFVEVARDDAALEQAVSEGPVAVGVNADLWQSYQSGNFCPSNGLGLLSGCGMLGLNHAVLVVGYDKDCWHIKNSWGEGWGMAGYICVCRKFKNNCGIHMMASYPIIA